MENTRRGRDRRFTEALDVELAEVADRIRSEFRAVVALAEEAGAAAGRDGWALVPRTGAHVSMMGPHQPLWRVPDAGPSVQMLDGWVWCPWACEPARVVVTHHGEASGDDDDAEIGTTHPVRLTCNGCLRVYDANTGEAL